MTTQTTAPKTKTLDELASDIKAGVALVRKAASGYLEACREVGRLLALAKEQGKGQWATWCKEKCGMTQQMAGHYIALVDDRDWAAVLEWAKAEAGEGDDDDDGDDEYVATRHSQPSLTGAAKVAREARDLREAAEEKAAAERKAAAEKAKREAWLAEHPEEVAKEQERQAKEQERQAAYKEQQAKEQAKKAAIEAAKKKAVEEFEAKEREEAERQRRQLEQLAKPITEQRLTEAMKKAGIKAQLRKLADMLTDLGFTVQLEAKAKAKAD